MKKLLSILLAMGLILTMAACGSNEPDPTGGNSTTPESKEPSGGTVAVFYYSYGDPYISSVRTALDAAFDGAGIAYQDYDSNSSQTTQTEQVTTAISKGASVLVVNLVDSSSDDAAQNIINLAKEKDIPVIFFNRSVSEEVISSYDKCAFVGTDYELAGHMQGEMIGQYLVDNFDKVDLNGDGVISYVMFKGEEGNAEAIARTQFGVEDANLKLTENDLAELSFYDSNNTDKYLVDQSGNWSADAANNYMQTILSKYSEANNNMVELVISNNDEMALGAISALQNAGYNLEDGSGVVIPVFGVDATDSARKAIAAGTMTGTIRQDADGMANTICQIAQNFSSGADKFNAVDTDNIVGTWRVNIPYSAYTGEE